MQSMRTAVASAAGMAALLRERYFASTEMAIYHSLRWLTTRLTDITYKNPNFKAPVTDNAVLNEGIAIYCVHGTADNVVAFDDAANYLAGCLPTAVSGMHLVAFDERGKGISIRDFARQLANKIIANGHKTVILAGHSRGGLVAAYLYEFLAREAGINVVFSFSIGSPYGGSPLALPPMTWVSKSVQEMQKDSDFLKELKAKKDSSHHYVCAAAADDYIVNVKDANFNEETPPTVFENQSHLSVMHDPKMLRFFHQTIHAEVHRVIPSSPFLSVAAEMKEEGSDEKSRKIVPALWDVYFEVTLYLEDLKRRVHLTSSADKIKIFTQLQWLVGEMLKGNRAPEYEKAKTVGEFLAVFLAEKTKPEMTVGKIIDQQLNYPLTLFLWDKDTDSREFINRLQVTYCDALLPSLENVANPSVLSVTQM